VLWTAPTGERCVLATAKDGYSVRLETLQSVVKHDVVMDEIQALSLAGQWRRELSVTSTVGGTWAGGASEPPLSARATRANRIGRHSSRRRAC
jgi:hypothetical protein